MAELYSARSLQSQQKFIWSSWHPLLLDFQFCWNLWSQPAQQKKQDKRVSTNGVKDVLMKNFIYSRNEVNFFQISAGETSHT